MLDSFFNIPETFKTLAKSFRRTVHWEPFTLLIFIACSINYFPIYRISINREAHIIFFIVTTHSNPILVRRRFFANVKQLIVKEGTVLTSKVHTGTVATVGFPNIGLQGFAPKFARGEIASLSGAGDDTRYFQISVPVQPGNSGGALVDEHGNVVGIVSAKLDASVALAASGALPENVNYAVKSSFLLSFLESVPAISAKLKVPNTADEKFSDVVKSAQDAAVLVLVY